MITSEISMNFCHKRALCSVMNIHSFDTGLLPTTSVAVKVKWVGSVCVHTVTF